MSRRSNWRSARPTLERKPHAFTPRGKGKRYRPPQDVLDARAKRGRALDTKLDRCKSCLHFMPPERCGLERRYTTAEGSCALHDRAASEVEVEWYKEGVTMDDLIGHLSGSPKSDQK